MLTAPDMPRPYVMENLHGTLIDSRFLVLAVKDNSHLTPLHSNLEACIL